MKIRVTLQDLKGQMHPEHDFWTDLDELPMVGDLIVKYAPEENEKTYEQWYPDLQLFGANEAFKVVLRGWGIFPEDGGEIVNPFIVVRNMDNN